MALARYTDTFWFPNGSIASNVPARVFPYASPALAPLWTDVTGTVPLPNPLNTTAFGVLDFWAEEGEYWIHLDSESFRVSVGSPNQDVFEIAASVMSTGILSGGDISTNAMNPSALDIAPLVGYVTDVLTDPVRPTSIRVSTGPLTIPLDAAALLRTPTWWLMDSAGNVIQQEPRPTNAQSRTHIILGATAQQGGTIFVSESRPVILQQPANQFYDLLESLGGFNISGNIVSPNGVNLMINQASGTLFARSFNHFLGAVQTNDPHVGTTLPQTPAQWLYSLRNTVAFPPAVSLIDPTMFDNSGVLSPVGGGANTATVQRIFLFPTNIASSQMTIQYGQSTFSSLTTALNSIGSGGHVVNPQFKGGALVAYLAVIRSATNLSDPAQAAFVTAGKFATP